MPDDVIECVGEHSSRLQSSINLHALVTTFMFSCSGTDVQLQRDEDWGTPCAVIEPYKILAPAQDLNPSSWIHSQK